MDNLTIILIMIAVMIVIPVIFARLSGRNPMEIFFGRRVNDTGFGAGEKKQDPQAAKKGKEEKNSSRNDLMVLISDLTTYARRNHFYMIMPGTLQHGGKTASLAAVIITRGMVLGINCFGFGGSVMAGSGRDDWTQTMNGEKKRFPSPTVKNQEQEKLLSRVLKDAGLEGTRYKVIGVFTAPGVRLSGLRDTACFDRGMMKTYLASDECMISRDLDPSAVGAALEPFVKRQKG